MLNIKYVNEVDEKILEELGELLEVRPTIAPKVERIIEDVRENGDTALLALTERFDSVTLTNLRVSSEAISVGADQIRSQDPELYTALGQAADRIKLFHEAQLNKLSLQADDLENEVEQVRRPLKRIGAYVPGGQASYPSTVLMTAVIAKTAGVGEVVVVTPPGKDGKVPNAVLAACKIAGVDELYSVGGAQAIAALAYGTESIRKVDKIVGPGNLFVTLAKKMVIDQVAIDMLAGPSEVLIIADKSADPRLVAADLLAQAEHAQDAVALLVTDSDELVHKVKEEIIQFTATSERKVLIERSLIDNGKAFVVSDLSLAAEIANIVAPEHLGIYLADHRPLVEKINSAGAIFIGNYSPQAIGDYCAGPSHVLPTGASARFASPLSVEDFLKRTSIIHLKKETFMEIAGIASKIAAAEGLTAHKHAIDIRLDRVERTTKNEPDNERPAIPTEEVSS